ncbi:MAG: HD domain-containing protein [Microscillaceae bacterium]|nr:HD domain-containing protein [Microscillaceae bacterium]
MASGLDVSQAIEDFVTDALLHHLPPSLHYHNLHHTRYVVKAAQQIAAQENLSEEERYLLHVSAWLHDIGYLHTRQSHEEIGREIARQQLEAIQSPEAHIQAVEAAILSTKIPQSPQSLMAQVLCDADLAHLADEDFFEICLPLRREWEAVEGQPMTDTAWLEANLQFMQKHAYFTRYGQQYLEPMKQENILKVQKKLKKLHKKENKTPPQNSDYDAENTKIVPKAGRGVETVFRTTSKNHLDLSAMADNKANILISINTIIVSVIISILIQKLDTNPHLIPPTFILLLTCIITIVLAILSTRPVVSSGKFSKEDVEARKVNLLFFGNFHQMDLNDYEWGMRALMYDAEYLYGSLIRDIYFLGRVLGRKYRLLRYAYTIFMYGLVVSVLAFVLAAFPFIAQPKPKAGPSLPATEQKTSPAPK